MLDPSHDYGVLDFVKQHGDELRWAIVATRIEPARVSRIVAELRHAARIEHDADKRLIPDGNSVFVLRLRGSDWTLVVDYALVPAIYDQESTGKLAARLSREAGDAIMFVNLAIERHEHGEAVEVADWTAKLERSPAKSMRDRSAQRDRTLSEVDRWFRERRILVPICAYVSDGYICRFEIHGIKKEDVAYLDVVILPES